MNLLKFSIQEKYAEEDLVLLTKMDISIPLKTQNLKHRMRNFAGITRRGFGLDSLLYLSLKGVAEHIESKERNYGYEFRQEKLFSGIFLDKINWRVHRFLDSCAQGNDTKIDTAKLEFNDLLEQIKLREYMTKILIWIRKLVKSANSAQKDKVVNDDGNGGGHRDSSPGRGGQKWRQFQDSDRHSHSIINSNMIDACRLGNMQLRDVFNPSNI